MTAVTTHRTACSSHARSSPSPDATDRVPEARSRSRSVRALAIARAAPASDGHREQGRERWRQRAGRAVPAVDGQQRDAKSERQPRPRRSLRYQVVRGPMARTVSARSTTPGPTAAASPMPTPTPAATITSAVLGVTSPAGMGLGGTRPLSAGASTTSFRAPIDELHRGHRDAEEDRALGHTAGDQGDACDDEAVEDRREGMDQPDQRVESGRRSLRRRRARGSSRPNTR